MSKMTMLVGPPLLGGMFDKMRASVKAVATSPSVSTCIHTRTHTAHCLWFDAALHDLSAYLLSHPHVCQHSTAWEARASLQAFTKTVLEPRCDVHGITGMHLDLHMYKMHHVQAWAQVGECKNGMTVCKPSGATQGPEWGGTNINSNCSTTPALLCP